MDGHFDVYEEMRVCCGVAVVDEKICKIVNSFYPGEVQELWDSRIVPPSCKVTAHAIYQSVFRPLNDLTSSTLRVRARAALEDVWRFA